MKRLFIAINLPKDAKDEITRKISKIEAPARRSLDVGGDFRWIPAENWHLTLVFLGYQPDEAIGPILDSIKETAKNFPAPEIEFEKIILAPPAFAKASAYAPDGASVDKSAGKPNKPARMIWLTGSKETSKALNEIKINLENSLIDGGVGFKIDNRPFNCHLTLCRFTNQSLIPFANIREFDSGLIRDLSFIPESLDLMESFLKRTGAEYEILAKFAQ